MPEAKILEVEVAEVLGIPVDHVDVTNDLEHITIRLSYDETEDLLDRIITAKGR